MVFVILYFLGTVKIQEEKTPEKHFNLGKRADLKVKIQTKPIITVLARFHVYNFIMFNR